MKYILPIALLLCGCMVGPKYHQPEIAMPAGFVENEGEEDTNETLSHWWKQFNDPVLDELIQEALSANYDLLTGLYEW